MTMQRLEQDQSVLPGLDRMKKAELKEVAVWQGANLMLLEERLAELELAIEDTGWLKLSYESEREFSSDGLTRLIQFARYMYLKNPLINHAVEVTADYVWSQGCTVLCEDEVINEVIQKHMNDFRNQRVFYGQQARIGNEKQTEVEGNVFFALFTNRANGWVRVRTVPTEQIIKGDIICNPEDREDVWFYKRVWAQREFNKDRGTFESISHVEYYPDWKYRPQVRQIRIDDKPVNWDAPIYHVKVGGLPGMRYGVPELYAALDWAKAVTEDLQDYATVKRALTRFAWNMKVPGGTKGVANARSRLASTLSIQNNAGETNPPPATGSTFIRDAAVDLQPMKVAGSQPSPDEGRRLWLMVSSGVGIPETILSGDADVGNLATAKTLDRPTELKMRNRQEMWGTITKDILGYVIDAAVRAPSGALPGTVLRDPITTEEVINVRPPLDRTINVTFPSILERDPKDRIAAIVSAATLDSKTKAGTLPDKTLVQLLLDALDVDDADEILNDLFPNGATELPDTTPIDPTTGLPLGGPPAQGGGPAGFGPPTLFEALRGLRDAYEEANNGAS